MIFVDANVPMYLVGPPDPNKDRSRFLLLRFTRDDERLFTSVEVYQEILHRYTAIRRPDGIDGALRVLDTVVDDVLSYGTSEIYEAKNILRATPGLSARDALHAAVMRSAGIHRIMSFDSGFDEIPGIERIR